MKQDIKDHIISFNYLDKIDKLGFFPKFPDRNEYMGTDWQSIGYIYIIELINNRFKLGRTNDIAARLIQHNKLSLSYSGQHLKQALIIGPFLNYISAERELTNLLKNPGKMEDVYRATFRIKAEIYKFYIPLLQKYTIKMQKHLNLPSKWDIEYFI